ncbi:MAG TPA: hypothetical protein VFY16_09120, partial [Gemmatimonadaceae bacterium]|nr:hypothetical protein [Gemmatimonadaceae bacterium]
REPLTPDLAAHYHLYAGRGLRIFGRVEQARAALRKSINLAGEHRFNQIVFQAEAALEEMEHGVAPEVQDAVGAPASLRDITEAIGELRELAGIVG